MKRLFFALDITKSDKDTLQQWQISHAPTDAKLVNKENFHITLAFLGGISEVEQEQLCLSAQNYQRKYFQTNSESFHCLANQYGTFSKAKVGYLGFSQFPDKLICLANQLSAQAKKLGLYQENRAYTPHLTLYRKAKTIKGVKPPHISLTIDSFSLYHSQSGPTGVSYTAINTWSLTQK